MPTIEISQEQADALARGENISIAPPQRRYIIVTAKNNVFDVLTKHEIKVGVDVPVYVTGECKLIAKGASYRPLGTVQNAVSGRGTVTAVKL